MYKNKICIFDNVKNIIKNLVFFYFKLIYLDNNNQNRTRGPSFTELCKRKS